MTVSDAQQDQKTEVSKKKFISDKNKREMRNTQQPILVKEENKKMIDVVKVSTKINENQRKQNIPDQQYIALPQTRERFSWVTKIIGFLVLIGATFTFALNKKCNF